LFVKHRVVDERLTFLRSGGSISWFVGVTLLRGVLSPLGHGTWTVILAGVFFRETRGRRFRLDGAVIGAYLIGAIAALRLVTVLAAVGGARLGRVLAPMLGSRASAALLAAVGVFVLASAARP
jgi:protease PrsW